MDMRKPAESLFEDMVEVQKAVAKIVIGKNKENTDAVMRSSTNILARLTKLEDKVEDIWQMETERAAAEQAAAEQAADRSAEEPSEESSFERTSIGQEELLLQRMQEEADRQEQKKELAELGEFVRNSLKQAVDIMAEQQQELKLIRGQQTVLMERLERMEQEYLSRPFRGSGEEEAAAQSPAKTEKEETDPQPSGEPGREETVSQSSAKAEKEETDPQPSGEPGREEAASQSSAKAEKEETDPQPSGEPGREEAASQSPEGKWEETEAVALKSDYFEEFAGPESGSEERERKDQRPESGFHEDGADFEINDFVLPDDFSQFKETDRPAENNLSDEEIDFMIDNLNLPEDPADFMIDNLDLPGDMDQVHALFLEEKRRGEETPSMPEDPAKANGMSFVPEDPAEANGMSFVPEDPAEGSVTPFIPKDPGEVGEAPFMTKEPEERSLDQGTETGEAVSAAGQPAGIEVLPVPEQIGEVESVKQDREKEEEPNPGQEESVSMEIAEESPDQETETGEALPVTELPAESEVSKNARPAGQTPPVERAPEKKGEPGRQRKEERPKQRSGAESRQQAGPQKARGAAAVIPDRMMTPEEIAALLEDL